MKMILFCAISAFISILWLVFIDMSHFYKVILYTSFSLNLFLSGFNFANEIELRKTKKMVEFRKNNLRF